MDYDFFAILSRMKYIKRWSLMHCAEDENVMEHTEQAAITAHALAVIKNKLFGGNVSVEKVLLYALYHETSEVITGDLPTPVKYFNDDVTSSFKALEKTACEKITSTLPPELTQDFKRAVFQEEGEEKIIVKCADKISAYIKCLIELKLGNKEFKKAKLSIEKEIAGYNRPEVEYFMKNFIPPFNKTLDELDL